MVSFIGITLLAFALSAIFCLGFRGLARQWHLIDTPNARKTHNGHIPLCGGIAIFLSFAATAFLTPTMGGSANAVLLLPSLLLILITGVADDRFDLPVAPRLAMQVLAAFTMVGMCGLTQIHLGFTPGLIETAAPTDMATTILTGPAFLLLALTFVVGLINAVNMSDGVDGLAGSASATSFFWLAIIGFAVGDYHIGLQTLALSAACIGFLAFNMRHRWRAKASIFLGDGGSTFLGAALAGIILILADTKAASAFPILIWVVIVPVIDTLSLIVRRLSLRRSPFSADRQHLHHLLLDNGLTDSQTTIAIMALNFVAGGIAYAAMCFEISATTMLVAPILPVIMHSVFVLRTSRGLRPIVVEAAQPVKTNITFPGATS